MDYTNVVLLLIGVFSAVIIGWTFIEESKNGDIRR